MRLALSWFFNSLKYPSLIIAFPLLLTCLNQNLFFTPPSYIDPWVYTGYFFSLPSHLQEFAGTYYGTRLPWILPGYWLHQLFSPVLANFILHACFYIVFLLTLHYLLRRYVEEKIVLITVFIIGLQPGILGAFGTDYIDGAGITYILLTIYFLEKAAISNKQTEYWLFGSGVASACLVHTNLFLMLLAPIFFLHFLLRVWHKLRWVYLIRCSIMVFLGGVALTLFLAIANKLAGGEYFFFKPSISFARSFSGQPSPYMPATWDWILRAYWLILPVLAMLNGAIFCFKKYFRFNRLPLDFGTVVQIDLFCVFALFAYQQFISHQAILSTHYYVSYLLPFTVTALFFQIFYGENSKQEKIRPYLLLLPIFILPYAISPLFLWEHLLHSAPYSRFFEIILPAKLLQIDYFRTFFAALLAIGIIVALTFFRFTPKRSIIVFACLGLLFSSVHRDSHPGIFCKKQEGGRQVEYLRLTADAHRFLQKVRGEKELRFWYDHREPLCPLIFRSISSTYLWGYRLLNENFPELPAEQAALLHSNKNLVVLQPSIQSNEKVEQVLLKLGFVASISDTKTFGDGDLQFRVDIYDLKNASENKMAEKFLSGNVFDVFDSKEKVLENYFERNVYAGKAEKAVRREEDGIVFVPTSRQDHLATPFYPILAKEGGDWIKVSLDFGEANLDRGLTLVVVQDQSYNSLAENASPFNGSQVDFYVPLRPDTKKVRFLLMGKKGESCYLPKKFKIEQARGFLNDATR